MTSEAQESNTYIFDPESSVEMARLIDLDRIFTKTMGGPLSAINDPTTLHTIVDLACGPGGWVLDVAHTLPEAEVVGVDVSKAMIKYAGARAASQGLANASFEVMNITQPLGFSDASFDLVNTRLLFGVLRQEAWQPFIAECMRILKPGGLLRMTEMVDCTTNSPADQMQYRLLYRALHDRGYGFSPDGRSIGVTAVLPHFLRLAGYQHLRHAVHVMELSAGAEAWIDYFRNIEVASKMMQHLLVGAGVATQEEVTHMYEQALIQLQGEDFCGITYYHTMLVEKPAA